MTLSPKGFVVVFAVPVKEERVEGLHTFIGRRLYVQHHAPGFEYTVALANYIFNGS